MSCQSLLALVVIQLGSRWYQRVPARKAGGLYKTRNQISKDGFVAAIPSRAFRGGMGIFTFNPTHPPLIAIHSTFRQSNLPRVLPPPAIEPSRAKRDR